MADRGYKYRKAWNAANYKQINIAVNPELLEAFKAACERTGVPMRQAIISLMKQQVGHSYIAKPLKKENAPDYSTRAKRKKAARAILEQLEAMREAAEEYKGGIPESMYNRLEEAENDVTAYEDAIAAMEGLYEGD